jgi:hypothetical protein
MELIANLQWQRKLGGQLGGLGIFPGDRVARIEWAAQGQGGWHASAGMGLHNRDRGVPHWLRDDCRERGFARRPPRALSDRR